jgi:hypothetical protein
MTILNKTDWKATLGTVAPTVATVLGGPLAGVAVGMIAKALGMGPGATEQDLEQAVLGATPDTLLRLKEVENQFTLEMERLGVDVEKIHAGDRSSARELAKTNMTPQIVLSFVFIGGYFAAIFALHGVLFQTAEINDQIIALFGALIGVFTRELSGIMQFWFGSSSGSTKKTDHIANMGKQNV